MSLLVKKSTSNALLDLISQKKQPSKKAFIPLPPESDHELVPWRVRWWAPDGCASVYIPPEGAIVGMALDFSKLQKSTDLDEDFATPLEHWYKADRLKSSVDTVEFVWLVLSDAVAELCLAKETPNKDKFPQMTAAIQLAKVTIVDRTDVVDGRTFSDAVVEQTVLGALSFGGESLPLAWRVRQKATEGSAQKWEIYHPCWQCGRVSHFAENVSPSSAGKWGVIEAEVTQGPLYAVLEETGKQSTDDDGNVTGVSWEFSRVFVTTNTADFPADTVPTRYNDGKRYKTVAIGAFSRASDDTGDNSLSFTQYHGGVIVEDIASESAAGAFVMPQTLFFDIASASLKEREVRFTGTGFVETGAVRTILEFSHATLSTVVTSVTNSGDALKRSTLELRAYSPKGLVPNQGAAETSTIIGLTPREANESSPYGGANSSSDL